MTTWISRYSAGMRIRFDGKRRITNARAGKRGVCEGPQKSTRAPRSGLALYVLSTVYAEYPTCAGLGLVKGAIRSHVPCKGHGCVDGYVTVLVTREEMNALTSGASDIVADGYRFMVVPHPSTLGIPGCVHCGGKGGCSHCDTASRAQ